MSAAGDDVEKVKDNGANLLYDFCKASGLGVS
jgi:hypothetical protein